MYYNSFFVVHNHLLAEPLWSVCFGELELFLHMLHYCMCNVISFLMYSINFWWKFIRCCPCTIFSRFVVQIMYTCISSNSIFLFLCSNTFRPDILNHFVFILDSCLFNLFSNTRIWKYAQTLLLNFNEIKCYMCALTADKTLILFVFMKYSVFIYRVYCGKDYL